MQLILVLIHRPAFNLAGMSRAPHLHVGLWDRRDFRVVAQAQNCGPSTLACAEVITFAYACRFVRLVEEESGCRVRHNCCRGCRVVVPALRFLVIDATCCLVVSAITGVWSQHRFQVVALGRNEWRGERAWAVNRGMLPAPLEVEITGGLLSCCCRHCG